MLNQRMDRHRIRRYGQWRPETECYHQFDVHYSQFEALHAVCFLHEDLHAVECKAGRPEQNTVL